MRQEKKVKDRPAIALVLFFCLAALVASGNENSEKIVNQLVI